MIYLDVLHYFLSWNTLFSPWQEHLISWKIFASFSSIIYFIQTSFFKWRRIESVSLDLSASSIWQDAIEFLLKNLRILFSIHQVPNLGISATSLNNLDRAHFITDSSLLRLFSLKLHCSSYLIFIFWDFTLISKQSDSKSPALNEA